LGIDRINNTLLRPLITRMKYMHIAKLCKIMKVVFNKILGILSIKVFFLNNFFVKVKKKFERDNDCFSRWGGGEGVVDKRL
jgi:hypothetical protein